jgi:hypothetical protein
MDSHLKPRISTIIALHGVLNLAFTMDRHEGPHIALFIGFHGGLYVAIFKDCYEGPICPYYRFAWRSLLSQYNGPLWRARNYP